MGFQVEKRSGKWYMMWSCPNFLHVIEDTVLGEADPNRPMKRVYFDQTMEQFEEVDKDDER
jgi:hypothetical protein